MKLLSILKDVLFEERLQNYRYKVIRVENSVYEFTIVDFLLKNLNYLVTFAYMIKTLDDKYVTDKKVYVIRYSYLKNYIDCYLAHIGLFDFEIAKVYNEAEKPKITIDNVNLKQYANGELILKPLGVVFQGQKIKGKQKESFPLHTHEADVFYSKFNKLVIQNCEL